MHQRHILALSNVIGVYPFIASKSLLSQLVIAFVMVASAAMHMSETKHGYDGGDLEDMSDTLLKADRIVACVAAAYYLPSLIFSPHFVQLAIIFTIGVSLMLIGEYRTRSPVHNLLIYPVCHLLWHFIVYFCIGVLETTTHR